ncbi:hypothetical protein PISMIDRAFT_546005 [Pisolithus microcarpus 441]|uniref:Unplaced genomic scaffold scaffold_68, whole genome shotgun sequence n=1 Tax=Pisolithus microcarpus 441 TaxID=765257 RepID=A0A0C9Y9T7_9AGAM|nr:hypothetical protein PISMIDRAFT_546005 [Pisolithus microcarpus 441]
MQPCPVIVKYRWARHAWKRALSALSVCRSKYQSVKGGFERKAVKLYCLGGKQRFGGANESRN